MSENIRLMLIDGHALVHRAFHALPEDLATSSGEVTNAVLGFSNILLKEIDTVSPTHVVMAMDRPAPTFRHKAFAAYKATRPGTPPPLVPQFARVRQVAEAMNIPICELDGFEADDILGTLARQAESRGVETVIVTGDLDSLQLVSDLVSVRSPLRNFSGTTTYDTDAVRARYGLEPWQLPDWKALVGDTSDNIPGVPGIGAKTATKLLSEHATLDGVLDNLDQLPEKSRCALAENRTQALESRELARIVRDAPVELDLDHSAHQDMDRARVMEVFAELEFYRLIERLQAAGSAPAASRQAPETSGTTQLSMFGGREAAEMAGALAVNEEASGLPGSLTRVVRTGDDLGDLVHELESAASFAFDSETTSTDPLRARLVGLSFATRHDAGWYVPVGHAEGEQVPLPEVLRALRPILENERASKIGHNLKYDIEVLSRYDIAVRGLEFDTMIAAYLVNGSGRGISLSALALARLGLDMTPIEHLIGKGKSQITMDLVDIDRVAAYAGADAIVSLRLRDILQQELQDRDLVDLFRTVEMPLIQVLSSMEQAGVALDTDVLAEMSRQMTEELGQLEARIYQAAGGPFNINSTQQLGQLLFVQLGLPSGRRTKTGYSTDNEVLEGLRGKHPIVDDILDYRQMLKLKSTYIDALPSLINPDTGKVHTDFNQAVAATGRLSSSNPNLQNIPVRGELGRRIRRAFVPRRRDNVILAADYSQIELRILAAMSGDERLTEAFRSGEDIHRATAAAVFGVPAGSVTPDQRRIAKVVNFGIIYGIGEARLAYETGISRAEAKEFIASYNRTYSGVKALMDDLRKRAAYYTYVVTMLGRRRYLPDIHSQNPGIRTAAERAAINMPIQGTAADIIKLAMNRLESALRENFSDAHMVLQVHDELVFDVPRKDLSAIATVVQESMESAVQLSVPLEVELKVGDDWYDMSPLELGA